MPTTPPSCTSHLPTRCVKDQFYPLQTREGSGRMLGHSHLR